MIKAIKKLWHCIITNKHPIGDFIWQLDADLDALNALIIEATKKSMDKNTAHLSKNNVKIYVNVT